jgi:hypothetical protein
MLLDETPEARSLEPPGRHADLAPWPGAPRAVHGASARGAFSRRPLLRGFRQGNSVASLLADRTFTAANDFDPDYDPWQDIRGTRYERHWSSFVDVNNSRRAALVRQQIDQEEDDRRTLAAGGWSGTFASVAAGFLDPTILLPAGGAVRAARGGFSVARSALMTGTAVGAGTAVQEALLQTSQETRELR